MAIPFGLLFVVVVNGVYLLLFLLRIVPALELPPAPVLQPLGPPDAVLRDIIARQGVDAKTLHDIADILRERTDPEGRRLLALLADLRGEDGVRRPPFFE